MLTYRRDGEKGSEEMWIETNRGDLVNLEKVRCIIIKGQKITYWFSEDDSCVEIFDFSRDAQHRMENLKKLLK